MYKIGYIKQTTKEQIEMQSELLISAGCKKLYVEPANNINFKSRTKLNEAIDSVKSTNTLVVTRLSVLSYSVQNLLQILCKLEEKQINLEVIEQKYKSNDVHSMDELLFYLSEFVEDIRKEKQAIGINRAKLKGKRLGRKPKLTVNKVKKAIYLKKFNTSKQVANRLGVGTSTLLRYIANYKNENWGKTMRVG